MSFKGRMFHAAPSDLMGEGLFDPNPVDQGQRRHPGLPRHGACARIRVDDRLHACSNDTPQVVGPKMATHLPHPRRSGPRQRAPPVMYTASTKPVSLLPVVPK
jgi:hypothetical protein